MYSKFLKFCVIFLYILASFITYSTAKHNKYKLYNIEDYKLCSDITKRKIKLGSDHTEAVLINQSSTKDHRVDWSKNFDCTFTIQANKEVFAVIQNINFRKNQSTGKCIDFVKFNTRDNQFQEELCGEFNVAFSNENTFYYTTDYYGYVETRIFISKEKLDSDFKMDLKIVYTRVQPCDRSYSSCNNKSKALCIHDALLNDGYVNCPIDCFDEISCPVYQDRQNYKKCGQNNCDSIESDSNSTKIILSAVTSLLISFIVFIVCIWICKKTGKLCWAARCRDNSPTEPSRVIEMQNRTQINQTEVPAGPDPEKDLPPSYDSLFPS